MKKQLLIGLVLLFLMSCGGKSDNPAPPAGGTGGTTPPPISSPGKVTLSFPDQNGVCTAGTGATAIQSTINFTWNASVNTDSYDLNLKNLLTGVITTQNTTAVQLSLTLLRNTPYSWNIISKSTKTTTTTQSDVWKFYNSGPGITTYAPFPAEITSPTFGQVVSTTTGTVNLTWKGSAVDVNTIAEYDVYLGTTKNPVMLKSGVTDSFYNNLSVTSNTTYYWKVVTKDKQGDTSDSGLYQFTIR